MLKNIILSKKRKKHVCFEYSNILIQSLVKNKLIKSSIRWYLNVHFTKIRKAVSKVKFKNSCVITGRSRSLYRFAKLSRLVLRDNQFIGQIPGLRKSYW